MKHAIALAAITAAALSASEQDVRAAPAAASASQPACASPKAPPKELVTKDLVPGSGKTVMFRTAVLVGYTGWLYDGCAPDFKGAKVDSSEGRATPLGFMVGTGRVIKGWDEGLIGMKEKGKRLLIVPAEKAYGEKGANDGKIPPDATLVFEVEVSQILFDPSTEKQKPK